MHTSTPRVGSSEECKSCWYATSNPGVKKKDKQQETKTNIKKGVLHLLQHVTVVLECIRHRKAVNALRDVPYWLVARKKSKRLVKLSQTVGTSGGWDTYIMIPTNEKTAKGPPGAWV